MRTIAIHPDHFVHRNGERQSFSDRWSELAAQAGIEVRAVDAYRQDIFDRLHGCDAFMWRFDFAAPERLFAKRLLAAIEQTMPLAVFPSWRTAWHFEDKVAQHYLLTAAAIPTARTWVFWDAESARAFCRDARYPLVLKLAQGYQSSNVRLMRNAAEASRWIDLLFTTGVASLDQQPVSTLRSAARHGREAVRALFGRSGGHQSEDVQRAYIYLQEFLDGNAFDTRDTVIGRRAFAFRRLNRPDDFRASGSGRIVWEPEQIDARAVALAVRVAQQLGSQSLAVDVLRRGDEVVVAEVSYTYASWAVRNCPGHWEQRSAAAGAAFDLAWVSGPMRPEDAIFADFIAQLPERQTGAVDICAAR
jgi:glutathione synthase/RimK-type ligase-like ATP-grasp enzyme